MKTRILILIMLGLIGLRYQQVRYQAQTNIASSGLDPAYQGKPWSTYGTKTNTSDLALQAAPGAGVSVFVTEAYCINSSASTVQAATITYGSTVVAVVNCPPAAKYSDPTFFNPPLRIPANTALTMQGVASVSTTYLFAAGTVAR